MNKLNNLDKKKRIILISSIITLIILGIVSATVAYFGWVGEESSISVTVIGGEGECSVKEDNNVFLEPTDTKNNGRIIKFTAKQTLAQEAYIVWTMNINKVNELNHNTFRYEMINTTTGASYGSGDFADVTDGSFIRFRNDQEVLAINTEYEFTLHLWIDGTIGNNPVTMAGKDLDFDMNCTMFDNIGEFDGGTIIDFIKHQYVKGIPSKITQANSDASYYYSYQDSEQTWGLMNDGLKVADEEGAGAIVITDVDTLTGANNTKIEGNIRYFGKNPNNYIYFNCDEYPSTNCEKWRIIGIVDGKVKLIRDESIGNYSWDNKNIATGAKSDLGSNNWADARLMRLLNPGHENFIDKDNSNNDLIANNSLYWNGESGKCYKNQNNGVADCDFTSIGLKNDKTKEMILKTTWYLGGWFKPEIYPNNMYHYERRNVSETTYHGINPYTIEAHIGLMYASDYGYGTDLSKCNDNMSLYNNEDSSYKCSDNNWLYNNKKFQWFISPYTSYNSHVWGVYSIGHAMGTYAYLPYSVRPVLYLDKNVLINGEGDGTSDNPYQIYLEPSTKLTEHITNLYTSGNPESLPQKDTNGNTIAEYYYSYQGDKSWGLMNDGLKIDTSLDATTTGLATTVTSIEALTSGTEGNIRYFGPSDKVNNYIYFNCSNYSNQTASTCEKWRIIGIVDGKVKIIRNESIGDLAWDQDKNQDSTKTTYSNDWENSSLQEFLNGLYYDRGTIESYPFYSGIDGSTTTTLNLKTIGITEATRTNNLISESTWYLVGYSTSEIYPNQIYAYERTNKKGTTIFSTNDFTIQKNIGLMYSSDYGYGTDLTKCSQNLYNYNNNADTYACKTNNWLINSNNQWLITPNSSYSSTAWYVTSLGFVNYLSNVYDAEYGVRPVLYLDSELTIESDGDGSSTNPYRIIVR